MMSHVVNFFFCQSDDKNLFHENAYENDCILIFHKHRKKEKKLFCESWTINQIAKTLMRLFINWLIFFHLSLNGHIWV